MSHCIGRLKFSVQISTLLDRVDSEKYSQPQFVQGWNFISWLTASIRVTIFSWQPCIRRSRFDVQDFVVRLSLNCSAWQFEDEFGPVWTLVQLFHLCCSRSRTSLEPSVREPDPDGLGDVQPPPGLRLEDDQPPKLVRPGLRSHRHRWPGGGTFYAEGKFSISLIWNAQLTELQRIQTWSVNP